MTLKEMFNLCDVCVYAPCLCGNEPENCVAYVKRHETELGVTKAMKMVAKEDEHEAD